MVEARSRFNDLGVIPLLPFDADFLGVRRRGVRLGVFLVDIVEGAIEVRMWRITKMKKIRNGRF